MTNYQIASIVNTYGLKGQIKVISATDFPEERFAPGKPVIVMKAGEELARTTITEARLQKGTYLLKLAGYDTINQVEGFKGGALMIDQDQQQPLEADTYYYHQIIGLKVETLEGQMLGTIVDILALGSNDVWVVRRPQANQSEALIPFIDDVVKEVDLDSGRVIIELMEGLIADAD